MMLVLLILMIIINLLMMISFFMKTQTHLKWQEKMSSFECGFDSNHSNRMAFSLRFFIITVVFLVFDVEMAIMLPIPLTEEKILFEKSFIVNLYFFIILMGGLIFEWNQGALEWAWGYI